MAYITEITNLKHQDECEWICDECGERKNTKYVAAKKNFSANNGRHICRNCYMTNHNPAKKENIKDGTLSKSEQEEIIEASCEICGDIKSLSKLAYRKNIQLNSKYICKSCAQKNKIIPQEQRNRISQTLTGREFTEEHKRNIGLSITPERIEKLKENSWNVGHTYSPFAGKTHSEETKEKMSESHSGKIFTEEHKNNISEGRKKMLQEQGGILEETKQKLSKIISNKITSGELNPYACVKHIPHTSVKCLNTSNSIRLKSSYEKKMCEILDSDPECNFYVYEELQVPYINEEGNERIYVPDFIVKCKNGQTKMIEVKPSRIMTNVEENKLKQQSAYKYCAQNGLVYEHWDENKLGIEDGEIYLNYEHIYKTYAEAKEATQKLGIKGSIEYKVRYKEDPKLPCSPSSVYPSWVSWGSFLRDEEQREIYKTYVEAREAVHQLGIKTRAEYWARYKEDSGLTCAPEDRYEGRGWVGYREFLKSV